MRPAQYAANAGRSGSFLSSTEAGGGSRRNPRNETGLRHPSHSPANLCNSSDFAYTAPPAVSMHGYKAGLHTAIPPRACTATAAAYRHINANCTHHPAYPPVIEIHPRTARTGPVHPLSTGQAAGYLSIFNMKEKQFYCKPYNCKIQRFPRLPFHFRLRCRI